MQEKSDQKCENGIEPSMNRHKPASEKTQVRFHLMLNAKHEYKSQIIKKNNCINKLRL